MYVQTFTSRPFYLLGVDIGSTTVKTVILNNDYDILFSAYERHFANIQETFASLLIQAQEKLGPMNLSPVITGSGGLTLSKAINAPFVQEVIAVSNSLTDFAPQTDVAIELGGEDAKIIYFTNGIEQRMNGICAGGTGSFIDQIASLLQTDATGLNEYAKTYDTIYPIAARCGVFAKSDIQPLINEGASKENLSASVFQAVVNQTISGLACGKPIRGNVAFLGGPLHFLSELQNAFIRTLHLTDEQIIAPEHSHLFAALGAAMSSEKEPIMTSEELIELLQKGIVLDQEIKRLDPLFKTEEAYEAFRLRHSTHYVKRKLLEDYEGLCFLGIDAGSTTTKVALVSEDGSLLYSFYSNNDGDPLATTIRSIKEIKSAIPSTARIAYSCSTGYGEALIKAALMLDEGEVETVAHYYAAAFFQPEVDCILDIGGQDMKCIKIKNNTVNNVLLNEACSSGCGSFIETFAKSLNFSVEGFAKTALFAKHPIDLGTRCTVFMNSNVKQAQKEGADASDISAGLAYSVIKNALYKVIKITDARDLGNHVVVQGGTFYNDAVLRSFEKIAGCKAIRPDIAGIMGAFGAALIAKERYEFALRSAKNNNGETLTSSMLSLQDIVDLDYSTSSTHCRKCTNTCRLTINTFSGNRRFISGNRCEKGAGSEKTHADIPNLFDYKMKRLFDYEPLSEEAASRGTIGIPRVLNMYENYPFWATFFKELGFRTILSPSSTRKIYELGIESIPSESECYPAKLVHGHIEWLIQNGVKTIFYPCIPYERNETPEAQNHFNCPMVTSYAENIKNNLETLHEKNITLLMPFMSFTNEEILTKELVKVIHKTFDIPENEIAIASKKGYAEMLQARRDTELEGERAIKYIDDHKIRGIVLAGRPYHIDPEVHHGISDLINSYGIAVLTEDSISHLANTDRPLMIMDQWMYHSRLYRAATYVRTNERLDLIQLNSFGCGLDAVTCETVNDILTKAGKLYTILKIDEVNNLGGARIRIRSLIAALRIRDLLTTEKPPIVSSAYKRAIFTKEMKKDYTILAPQMSPIHFDFLEVALRRYGYRVVMMSESKNVADIGLKYVNNDACYPSLLVVGQIMEAILSGEYDLSKTAVFMTQTGGGCRASNYVGFIRRALEKANLSHIPVISVNTSSIESNPGFKFTPASTVAAMQSLIYGDVFMRVLYRTRPYEAVKGSANALYEKWKTIILESFKPGNSLHFAKTVRAIIRDFDELPLLDIQKPRVGIVGEILVKFLPAANNHVVDLLEAEGAEAVMPDLMDFFQYCFYNQNFKAKHLGTSKKTAFVSNLGIKFLDYLRRVPNKEFAKSKRFAPPVKIDKLAKMTEPIVSLGNQTGEGWFLTAEMLELIHSGVNNIICAQPFACLPNHIVGKGVIKELRKQYPLANITAIDYDPGASEVNQLNRIKLMLSVANKNLSEI